MQLDAGRTCQEDIDSNVNMVADMYALSSGTDNRVRINANIRSYGYSACSIKPSSAIDLNVTAYCCETRRSEFFNAQKPIDHWYLYPLVIC